MYTIQTSVANLSADLPWAMVAGEVMFGTDSHTCNAGAFGQFASGIGNTDAGFILGTGKLLIKVPPSIRFVLDGEMPPYLLAKDIILQIIGEITVAGNRCYSLVPGCPVMLVTSHIPCLSTAKNCVAVKCDWQPLGLQFDQGIDVTLARQGNNLAQKLPVVQ